MNMWRAALFICTAFGWAAGSAAQTLAPVGCPVFHCTTEATGVMYQPIIQQPISVTVNSALGTLRAQGCSGDGSRLSCLFATDTTTGIGQGTLKVLDATTLQPIWGSAGAPNSRDLDAASSAGGQVPLVFSNGNVAAGDASAYVLYDASGAVLNQLAVGGIGNNFGLTPISETYGIVSQTDGVLTLVNMSTWQPISVLTLRDPVTAAPVSLVSPSSATANVLYAVGFNSSNGRGFLFSVVVDPVTQSLKVRSTLTFRGRTGASPVVVTPSISGLSNNLILLHVPGLISDPQPQNRLVGLLDYGTGFKAAWVVSLTQALPVSPAIDQVSYSLFFGYNNDVRVYQYNFLSGAQVNVFDIQALGAFPGTFALNGHLASTQTGTVFTLLLSGTVTSAPVGNGQYVMAFTPIAAPSTLLWQASILRSRSYAYTAAWILGPSSQPGVYCPIVVGVSAATGGITRLCDF